MRKKYLSAVLYIVGLGIMAGFLLNFTPSRSVSWPVRQIFHNSYFSQSDFFDQAFQSAKPAKDRPANIKAILVNHHLLAGNFIAESFNYIATSSPVTVVLISPNHFSAGRANFIMSAGIWHTPYGDLPPDSDLIRKISNAQLASVEEPPFDQEHGISGIVPFIKKTLPNAKVVPIIIKDHVTFEQAGQIADGISGLMPKNSLLVLSFDFSHYLTGRAADFHDIKSLAAVENFDLSSVSRLDSDSRPGLVFSLKLLADFGDEHFTLLENTNSAALTHQDILETTSYITGYFTAGLPKSAPVETLLVFPPISLTAATLAGFDRYGKDFTVQYLERLFTGQDITIAGISGQNTEGGSSVLKRFGFTNIIAGSQNIQAGVLIFASLALPDSASMGQKQVAARAKIDNGADLVVVGGKYNSPVEVYKNKIIIYGQGAGLTDETFNHGSVSVGYGIVLANHNLKVTLLPFAAQGGKYKLLIGKQNDTILSELAALSDPAISGQIKLGIINISNFK